MIVSTPTDPAPGVASEMVGHIAMMVGVPGKATPTYDVAQMGRTDANNKGPKILKTVHLESIKGWGIGGGDNFLGFWTPPEP